MCCYVHALKSTTVTTYIKNMPIKNYWPQHCHPIVPKQLRIYSSHWQQSMPSMERLRRMVWNGVLYLLWFKMFESLKNWIVDGDSPRTCWNMLNIGGAFPKLDGAEWCFLWCWTGRFALDPALDPEARGKLVTCVCQKPGATWKATGWVKIWYPKIFIWLVVWNILYFP